MTWNPDRNVEAGTRSGMTNARRAERVEMALRTYPDEDLDINAQDLLADLMHLCDRDEIDFNELLLIARSRHDEER
jgi:hypothetical protein